MTEDADSTRPEAAGVDDVSGIFDDAAATADLKAKVAEAWREFTQLLAGALPQLTDATTIDITLDPTASGTGDAVYGVQLQFDGSLVTGLAVGNADLPPSYHLDRVAVASLVALGWSPPGVVAGSGEAFGIQLPVTDARRIAVLVSRTLRDVYRAPHPAFLTYTARGFDSHTPVTIPALGAARLLAEAQDAAEEIEMVSEDVATERALAELTVGLAKGGEGLSLADRVAIVVARLLKTTPDALPFDPDGDIGIRAGSAMVFVRTCSRRSSPRSSRRTSCTPSSPT